MEYFLKIDGIEKAMSNLIGPAGEYWVMCELLRRGFIAALAPVGVPNTDIVVTDQIGSLLFAIQVKARQEKGSDKGWHMKPKHTQLKSSSLFYCFVDFGKEGLEQPKSWVVPSTIVADCIFENHVAWLSSPGKKGQERNDNKVRRFLLDYTKLTGRDTVYTKGWLDKYAENWSQLRP